MTLFSRLRNLKILRYVGIGLAGVLAILAIAIFVSLRVDLGPSLRALAERQGSNQLKRPVHIGGLSIRIARGRFEVDDFSIEGVKADDRPFFAAKKLSISLDWGKAFQRRPEFVITSVEMTDWQMLVEKWEKGDSFVRFRRASGGRPPGPPRFVTTLKYLRASRGQFAYEDHETPWSMLAPNIDINITNSQGYNGDATFHGGLVTIQNYVPMWADFKAHFFIDGPQLHLDRIEMNTDGAVSTAQGDLNFDQWPEMTYQVKSRLQFQRMRELFFKDEDWQVSGDGDFAGTFHLFKGGHDLTGDFQSEVAGLYDYRFPQLYGSLHWNRKFFEVTSAGSKFSGGDAKFTFGIAPLGEPTKPTGRFDASYTNVDLDAADRLLSPRRSAVFRACQRSQPARVADGSIPRASRRRTGLRRSARRHRDDGAITRDGTRGRPGPFAARVGAIPARPAGGAHSDRRGGDLQVRPGSR